MTENVEGVTAEETTASESVENTTPETEVKEQADKEVEAKTEGTPTEDDKETSEEVDWEARAKKAEAQIKEHETKIARQKAANRAQSERIEEMSAEKQKLQDKLDNLQPPKEEDYDDLDEFQKASLKHELKQEALKDEISESDEQLQKEQSAQLEVAREAFAENWEAVKKEDPNIEQNMGVLESYMKMVPPEDAGMKAYGEYMMFESQNNAALMNHLGANPEKIEALFGKPPAWIKQKLAAYEKELSVPKAPEPQPSLPTPPSPTKGKATPKTPVEKMTGDQLLASIRS